MSAGGRKTNYSYNPRRESEPGMRIWEVPGTCLGIVAQCSIRLLVLSALIYGGYVVLSKIAEFTGNGGLPGAIDIPLSIESLQNLGSTLSETRTPFSGEISKLICRISQGIIGCNN
jgi:hypothetical protein